MQVLWLQIERNQRDVLAYVRYRNNLIYINQGITITYREHDWLVGDLLDVGHTCSRVISKPRRDNVI